MDNSARRTAQARFRVFWILNAIPVAFLLEDVLVLYGIRNGLPEPALAALASFVQLTMPFMLLGRLFSARFGLAGAWVRAYLIRYTAVSVLLVVPFLPSAALRTAVVLGAGFVFAAFRAVGVINMHPLYGEITTEEERGRYLHGNFAFFNAAYVVAVLVSIVATDRFASTWIFQVLIATGVTVGLLSLLILRRVPESGEASAAARRPLLEVLRDVRRTIRLGVLIPAWAGGLMSFVLVIPFAILMLKGGYGIDDSTALRFTLFTLLGSVASGLANRRFTQRYRPATLVTVYVALLTVVAIGWATAPDTYSAIRATVLFFSAGFARAGIIVGMQHHLISTNAPEHRMYVSLLVELTGAAVSGLTGTIIGGTLLHAFGLRFDGPEIYRKYFLVVVGILVIALVFVSRLRKEYRS